MLVQYSDYRVCPKCGAIYDATYKDRFCICGAFLLQQDESLRGMPLRGSGKFGGTYEQIQYFIKKRYGVSVKPCWIAHVKDAYGLTRGPAPNRNLFGRTNPCPAKYWHKIVEALKYYGLIPSE